ncbi:MAG TPA: DUF881 domain-containing protein [Acidimicrobiales bacterium]|nr:DUF881 domain-containing protein [Acidimicrobiales bacterium]
MPRPRYRHLLAVGFVILGFLGVTVARTRPADPATRLSREYRLADLIERQQRSTTELRSQVAHLRADVEKARSAQAGGEAQAADREGQLSELGLAAGLVGVEGPGVRVTLDDSSLDRAPSGNVNDLVIHSQDVQAVVNALWRAGAEAVAINGQRLVSTSAVLCVGNTLLLNGTVHSPPYTVSAIGASRDRFEADSLVQRLHEDAGAFGLRFSVDREDSVEVPAFRGATTLTYARPAA